MKKAIMILAAIMVVSFSGSALAFLDDNSVDNSTNANADAAVNTNTVNDNRDFSQSNNKRSFANQGIVNMPGAPGFFGQTTKGSKFQSIRSILLYGDVFTLAELDRMTKKGTGLGFLGTKVIVTPLVEKVDKDLRVDAMKVVLVKPEMSVLKGYITVNATNDGKVSPAIMAEAILAARALGANAIHVSAEGVERVIKAFGWGIGLSYTKATISDTETSGGVASGGTGISGGTAGYKDRPWIQLFAIDILAE